ncbi:MAG: DUF5777 family beta-barrel protein [Sediminibacterium sp.]|nr:DUF5777 family beta-barrel protein [Sediminibacterium sp.]MDP3127729.1 DUF5777 family beta-barrel protein [Sediminibacterium sp.]
MKKKIITFSAAILLVVLFSQRIQAQEKDLLELVREDKPQKEIVKNAFKSIRVINGHSMEFLSPGTMDFRILHRFGQLNQGAKNLFGLDQASMRLGLDFGLTQNLMVGVGRSTFKKELDGYIKYAPIRQSTGSHVFQLHVSNAAGMNERAFVTETTASWEKIDIRFGFNLSRVFQLWKVKR